MGEVMAAGINATASGVNTYMQTQSNEAIAGKQTEAQRYVSDKQYQAAKDQLDYAKQVYGEQSSAYKQAYQKAQQAAKQAGTELGAEYKTAETKAMETPVEIQQLKSDMLSGNAEQLQQARNQMAANLATSGVRGGQAAALMNRAAGTQSKESSRQINELMANVANQSKAYQQALLQQKLAGKESSRQGLQNFIYNAESAKYAQ